MRRASVRPLTMNIVVARAVDTVILGLITHSVQAIIGFSGCRGGCVVRMAAIIVESVPPLVHISSNFFEVSSADFHIIAMEEHGHRARGERCNEPTRYRVL